MLTDGLLRSETWNVVAPERRARNSAVWGRICISPTAPADDVRASNFVSA